MEAPLGNVAQVPDTRRYILSQRVVLLRFDSRRATNEFAAHQLRSARVQRNLERWSTGTTATGIQRARLIRVPLSVPPLPEQRAIAAILDTIDVAIRKTEQVIAKLRQLKQGLLHDLLTRGIDDDGKLRDPDRYPEHFRESALGLIPRVWEVVNLADVAEVDRGKFTHRPRNDPAFYGGRYPFIQTGDVAAAEGGELRTASQSLSERGVAVSREFPAGTIAITIAANIADTAILGIPMYFPDSVVGAIVRVPNVVRFVQLCVQRAKRGLDARAPQSAQKNINLQDLRPLLVPRPPPEEQNRIALRYDTALQVIGTEERALQKLGLLKRGLMEDLLTGRVRVSELLRKGAGE
jgi:type I restriction enzyme, S subunit